jgi:hypothetical protein
MSQNDFNLANQGFPAMRADMNSAFQALASNSSGATEPGTTYAYQWWYDETTDILKIRNADDDAWINIASFDQANDTWSPYVGATALTATGAELNLLDGATVTTAELNQLDGNTFTADLTIPDKIIHSGDTDTSIRFPAADTVTVETAGSERVRVDSSGNLLVGTTDTDPADNNVTGTAISAGGRVSINQAGSALYVGRNGDGTLVTFFESGVVEGTISVTGTTVSYNGGHLARWAQTVDNTRPQGLLKGTILTNLDQMAVWLDPQTNEPQQNEQLNCLAVSSVEGDPNVAGVFVNWDDDDEVFTADMNIAMTGDMIIRIAQGVTVQRGDLLMSAGDGTAKPQGDDIVRSKTIAKVTSTHVTCTYQDGSYCVPCVLMAC